MKNKERKISAKFIAGGETLKALKAPELPEIAIVGRSNAGKSTLLNRLTNNSRLSRVSSMPGRTQQINLFEISIAMSRSKVKRLILADLPGFGYAKVSHAKRQSLVELIHGYLTGRRKLELVVLLNDCRRLPEADEIAIQRLAFEHGVRLIVALTKADKLKQSEIKPASRSIADGYNLEAGDLVLTGEKIPVEPLWDRILTALE